jgi:hypothetical protein
MQVALPRPAATAGNIKVLKSGIFDVSNAQCKASLHMRLGEAADRAAGAAIMMWNLSRSAPPQYDHVYLICISVQHAVRPATKRFTTGSPHACETAADGMLHVSRPSVRTKLRALIFKTSVCLMHLHNTRGSDQHSCCADSL